MYLKLDLQILPASKFLVNSFTTLLKKRFVPAMRKSSTCNTRIPSNLPSTLHKNNAASKTDWVHPNLNRRSFTLLNHALAASFNP